MTSIWLRIFPYICAALLVAGALFGAYHHGVTMTNAEWQVKWDARNTKDETATAAAELSARTLEQQRQQSADKVQRDATQKLEQARTDAASANAAADGLRQRVQQLLAASGSGSHSTVTGSCSTVTNPGNLLAVVLDKSVQRNRELAEVADIARVKGLACEAAYDALVNHK